jgi:hypothetical protein
MVVPVPASAALAPRPETAGVAGCPVHMGRPVVLPLRALDLAFLGADRLVVLDSAEVALFALGDGSATLLSRKSLPGPLDTVRAPGALLQASEPDAAVWALTSRSARAVLFAVEDKDLVEREQAAALPFPATAGGLRFRAGTNLIEGDVEGLGAGPFLDVVTAGSLFAVSPEGRLLMAGGTDAPIRLGPTLAALWPGFVAASTASPPGEDDALVVIAIEAAAPLMSCPTPGSVRAMAARVRDDVARLAVAVDAPDGRSSLFLFEIVHPHPPSPSAAGLRHR